MDCTNKALQQGALEKRLAAIDAILNSVSERDRELNDAKAAYDAAFEEIQTTMETVGGELVSQ